MKTIEGEITTPIRVEGFFSWQLISRGGIILRESAPTKNVITDNALDYICGTPNLGSSIAHLVSAAGQASPRWVGVGTGSTTPTAADTTLDTEVSPASTNRTQANGGFSSTTGYVSGPPDYWWRTATYLFDFNQGNGNLTEIGLFGAVTGGMMSTRQLIKDSGGTPTTLVKTSDEQLRVQYTIRVYLLQSDIADTVTFSGQTYDIVTRAANAGQSSMNHAQSMWSQGGNGAGAYETQTLGARTGIPTGSHAFATSSTWASYSAGTYYRDRTHEWATGIANFATGIGAVTHGMTGGTSTGERPFQTSFDPKIAKDNLKRLRLVFRYSVDRV